MNKQQLSRAINAVVLFTKMTADCGKFKLFKLLFLLDFEHYRQTGRSVTGIEYKATKTGPAPALAAEERPVVNAALNLALSAGKELTSDQESQIYRVKDGIDFDDIDFTPRQIKIIWGLIDRYRNVSSSDMKEIAEIRSTWLKVWSSGRGEDTSIPYSLALPEEANDREYIIESALEAAGLTLATDATYY